jgi:hypothetical protein
LISSIYGIQQGFLMKKLIYIAILFFLSLEASSSSIELKEVGERLDEVSFRIENIRRFMGKPKAPPINIAIAQTSNTAIFSQISVLYKKVNQLVFEQTAFHEGKLKLQSNENALASAILFLKEIDKRLRSVDNDFTIGHSHKVFKLKEREYTALSITEKLFYLNRQVNLMLAKPISPGKVFQKMEVLRSTLISIMNCSNIKKIEVRDGKNIEKTPGDVYKKLFEIYSLLSVSLEKAGLDIVKLILPKKKIDKTTIFPGDVYDFASVLNFETYKLHKKICKKEFITEELYFGRKYPFQVFNRLIQIEQLLVKLNNEK